MQSYKKIKCITRTITELSLLERITKVCKALG